MMGRVSRDAEKVNELKRDIAIHGYQVDAHEIAEAILRKLWLARKSRLVLAGIEAGQIPQSGPNGPPIR